MFLALRVLLRMYIDDELILVEFCPECLVLNQHFALQWRHNERDGMWYHQRRHCLLKRLFRRRSKKHQSSVSQAFVWGIHRSPVNSPHKGPVTWKMLPFDDVIMVTYNVILWWTFNTLRPGDAFMYQWTVSSLVQVTARHEGSLLLTWINFNPSMDK